VIYLSSPVPHEVKAVIYSCLSLISHPHLAHLRPKICSLIVENSFRVIHNSSIALSLPTSASSNLPKGRVDLDSQLSQNNSSFSFFKELIPWTLYACRYVNRSDLPEYLPSLFSAICRHIPDDISRTKLIAECVVLLLINVDSNGTIAHPEVLYQTLGHPVISSYLHLESSSSSSSPSSSSSANPENISNPHFRERFITALCRGIVKLIPTAVAYVLSTDGKLSNLNPTNDNGDDTFGDSVIDLSNAIPSASSTTVASTSTSLRKRLPYGGVGCYAELCGSTLRTTAHENKNHEQSSSALSASAELALQQLDNLVACALFVLRSSHK
jgi:hypothetical protein